MKKVNLKASSSEYIFVLNLISGALAYLNPPSVISNELTPPISSVTGVISASVPRELETEMNLKKTKMFGLMMLT